MPDETIDLKTWMDERGVGPEELAKALKVEPQTVKNWRSIGVPARRRPHLQYVIQNWVDSAPAPASQLQPLVVHATREQFRKWNQAAISSNPPLLLEDWAVKGLDQLAAEWERKPRALPDPDWSKETATRVAEGEK